jgi:hypothetical protein
MYRFQYSIVTNTSAHGAWEVFSDWNRWNSFASVYGEMRWREGAPWSIGSRMEIEIVRPVKAVIDHLIICCAPGREIGWIDRALGITIGQWVEFEKQGPETTRVKTWGEVSPSGRVVGERPVEALVESFIATWYENFRRTCDHLAESKN